jgi:PhnB protein
MPDRRSRIEGDRVLRRGGRGQGAVELPRAGQGVVHAELEVGDSIITIEDAMEMMGTEAPPAGVFPGSPVYHFVYAEDADTAIDRAVQRGSSLKRPVQDQFHGDRTGFVIDPFGHGSVIASHREDVAPEEMEHRLNAVVAAG